MKTVSISGSLRENVGKKDAKKHRKEGMVPCVIYGGEKQIHFSTSELHFSKLLFSPDTFIININVDGKEYHTILQDIQYHPVSDRILHMDFLQIFEDKPVKIAIPVRFTGTSKGVLKGGRLIKKYRKLMVRALPTNLPDEIVVDIAAMDIGSTIKVSQLLRENLDFFDVQTSVVCTVKSARGTTAEEDAEDEAAAAAAEAKEGGAPAAEATEAKE